MKTIYVRYDPSKKEGNILGLHVKVPGGNYIVVDASLEANITRFPNNYFVQEKKLVQIQDVAKILEKITEKNKNKIQVSKIISSIYAPLVIEGKTFDLKPKTIPILNLNLSICSIDKDHKTSIECIENGKQVLAILDKNQLLNLAIAFDKRRVDVLKNKYK